MLYYVIFLLLYSKSRIHKKKIATQLQVKMSKLIELNN